jgi:hypothetical protein
MACNRETTYDVELSDTVVVVNDATTETTSTLMRDVAEDDEIMLDENPPIVTDLVSGVSLQDNPLTEDTAGDCIQNYPIPSSCYDNWVDFYSNSYVTDIPSWSGGDCDDCETSSDTSWDGKFYFTAGCDISATEYAIWLPDWTNNWSIGGKQLHYSPSLSYDGENGQYFIYISCYDADLGLDIPIFEGYKYTGGDPSGIYDSVAGCAGGTLNVAKY